MGSLSRTMPPQMHAMPLEGRLVEAKGSTFDFTGHKMAKTRIISKWLTKLTHLCCVLSLF